MKKFEVVVDRLLSVLFITDLWVFLYTHLLTLLNKAYPAHVTEFFYRPTLANPEPFEISLYIILTACFVLGIWILHRFKLPNSHVFFISKIIALVILSVIFIHSLGQYPLGLQIDPYPMRADSSLYTFGFMIYILTISVIVFEVTVLNTVLKGTKYGRLILYGLIFILIAAVTFEAHFPIAGLDYPFFYGPIMEVVNGKTIFTDVISQYGYLSILFFALLHKIHLFSIAYLPAIIWFLYCVEYFLCFGMFLAFSNSIFFALVGLFSILTVNYFSLIHLPIVIPEIGPFRWIPLIIAPVLFYYQKKISEKWFIFCIALSSFWTIDAGISLLLAYTATTGIFAISGAVTYKKAIQQLVMLSLTVIGIHLTISIIHIALGHTYVDVVGALSSVRKYAAAGLGMIALPYQNFFWITIATYFLAIVIFFRQKKPGIHLQTIVFSANIMLFGSMYYVGRSHTHNLFHVAIFMLFTLFLILGVFISTISSTRLKYLLCIILFSLFIIYPAYMRRFTLVEMVMTNFHALQLGHIFHPEMDNLLHTMYKKDIDFVKTNMPENDIAILSTDDTFLFYLTGKHNLLDVNPQFGIDSKHDMDFALKTIVKKCPQKIVVDCFAVGKCSESSTFGGTFFNTAFVLEALENKCFTTYRPTLCSNHLCIAQKQK